MLSVSICIVFFLASASYCNSNIPILSVERRQQVAQVQRHDPEIGINPELDCGMRRLFFEMAKKAVPWRSSMMDVFDALELGRYRCNDVVYDSMSIMEQHPTSIDEGGRHISVTEKVDTEHAFHVCQEKGNDTNSGSQTQPFLTIHRALEATRDLARSDESVTAMMRKSIILYPGIHFLKETIILKAPLDSHLTIRSASASSSDGVPTA
mmetsp:Transcript_5061/g.9055  ORF Transcript_5061/g.9055 Transcript_5061/m.9055 type:complete len:209 (+) Transcript_5061:99-725(+)